MGYSTFFTGAIKITPRPDDELIIGMNVWLAMRHHKGLVEPRYQAILTHRAWYPDGPQIVDPKMVLNKMKDSKSPKNVKKLSDVMLSTLVYYEPIPPHDGFCPGYNYPEIDDLSLWSNIKIYPDMDCAYIAWDESEKAYEMDKWFTLLVNIFDQKDYQCKGVIKAQGEKFDDKWSIIVKQNKTKVIYDHECKTTFQDELDEIRSKIIW